MKSVAYIHSYPGAAPVIEMLWSGYKKLGIPLIGVDCEGEPTEWPEPIPTIEAGHNAYFNTDAYNLPSRLVLTLKHFLTTESDRALVMEYDTLISGTIPNYPAGFVGQMAGGILPGSKASCFWHTPWIFDREAAATAIRDGMEIMASGIVGRYPHGSPDVFLGLITDRGMKATDSGTFSRNTIDQPQDIALARKAYSDGCWFIHGVKTRVQLEAITA